MVDPKLTWRLWSSLVLSPLRWRPSCQSLRGRPRSQSCWSEWCSDGPRDMAGHGRTHVDRHHIGSRYGRQRNEETCPSGTGEVLKTHLVKQDLLYSQLLCPVAIAQETFAAANQLSGDKCEKSITNIPSSRYVERLCGQGLSMMWLTLQARKQRSSNSKDTWAVGQ